MVRPFKFFVGTEDDDSIDDGYDGASWIFGVPENMDGHQYEIVTEYSYGIHPFLNNFPRGFIVTVLSIVGPNGRIHNHSTEYDDGWGFDITNDLITIEWARFIP